MGSVDRADDRTFKVNFSSEGAAKLKDTVKEKLKEFMGDYTDDTLVEYVIVLLRNGRQKAEARNELDVFLADDSDSFVSWLWDHLASSLDLYVQAEEPEVAKETKAKPLLEKQHEGNLTQSAVSQEGIKASNLLRSRHNREWKGIVKDAAEPPVLLSSEIEVVNVEKPHARQVGRSKRSGSPRRQRKRSRSEERNNQKKRELLSQSIAAPRRLLQFAVREAVATAVPDPATGSSLKRLRSVVSTSASDQSHLDRASRVHSVSRMPNAMATVIKAVAEAAEDVRRAKVPGSVFDRLGHGLDVVAPESIEMEAVHRDEYNDVDFEHFQEEQPRYVERQQLSDDDMMMVMEREVELVSDYPSEYEQYEEVHIAARDALPQIDPLAKDAFTVEHSVVNNCDDRSRLGWNKDEDELPAAANNTVNGLGNVSAWKPPQYRAKHEIAEPQGQRPLRRITLPRAKHDLHGMKENGGLVSTANKNANGAIQKLQSTSGLFNQSMEDADLRTIFVNNVHTAATKDSLSQHFSKFGEVGKVIIHSDATTGQPIGSATIEFSQIATADSALSLDGTPFMSRVLKVVKRSSGIQKPAAAASPSPSPAMSWSRAVRNPGTPPYARYHPRSASPFARGGGFRSRGAVRGSARSLQWKREGQSAPAATANNSVTPPVPAARRFTYIRTEARPPTSTTDDAT